MVVGVDCELMWLCWICEYWSGYIVGSDRLVVCFLFGVEYVCVIVVLGCVFWVCVIGFDELINV